MNLSSCSIRWSTCWNSDLETGAATFVEEEEDARFRSEEEEPESEDGADEGELEPNDRARIAEGGRSPEVGWENEMGVGVEENRRLEGLGSDNGEETAGSCCPPSRDR